MINVLLVCSAGMSTSMLAKKMRDAAAAKGVEAQVRAVAEQVAADNIDEADVVLVGPQMRFKVEEFQKEYPNKPVAAIDARNYGMMDGAAVMEEVLEMLG